MALTRTFNTRKSLEMWSWIAAIAALYFLPPASEGHYSLCLFSLLGMDFCPGCGLGSSIHAILHGQWSQGLKTHWFGWPALAILSYRIIQLAIKTTHNGELDDEFSRSAT